MKTERFRIIRSSLLLAGLGRRRGGGGRVVPVAAAVVIAAALAGCSPSTSPPPSLTPPQLLSAGISAAAKGNSDQSRADYQAVIQHDPSDRYGVNSLAWYDLGVLDQKEGHLRAAHSEYQYALNLDPKSVHALYNLAVLETTSDPVGAVSLYRKVLTLRPNDPNSQWNLGLLLYRSGQVAEGRMLLNSAIKLAPSLAKKLPSGVTLTSEVSHHLRGPSIELRRIPLLGRPR